MSREVLHDLNGLLAAQVDAFAVALEQRDQARRIAVQLEQESARYAAAFDELVGLIEKAKDADYDGRDLADDTPCDCTHAECHAVGAHWGYSHAVVIVRDYRDRLASVGATEVAR